MRVLKRSRAAHDSARPAWRSIRRTRTSLLWDCLEARQLLSAQGSTASLGQTTAQPSIDITLMASTGPVGYSPEQIQTAYGVNQIFFSGGKVSGNGAGQTIAIIDAYNDPNIASDLATFDSEYGLPAPPTFSVENLGATSTNAGWALETSLDVEWAHALAPQANIVLVEASSSSLSSLFGAVSYASKLPGVSVVSMSWGTTEFQGESTYDSLFTTPAGHNGVAYVAASGDSGAWYGPMYPSVSPNVLAAGGTTLTLASNGSYGSETGWSDSTGGYSGTDSGFSSYEPAPSYQVAAQEASGINYGARTTPDVSFDANPDTGVAVYDSVSYDGQKGWFQVGGTSVAAPAWAGLIAIADQGLATAGKGSLTSTQVLTDLYNLPSSDYHEITSGNNGYSATPGYNLVTGLGSPKANLLIPGVLSENGVSDPVSAENNVLPITVSASPRFSHRFDETAPSGSGAESGNGLSNAFGPGLAGGTQASATSSGSVQLTALADAGQGLTNETGTSSVNGLVSESSAAAAITQSSVSPASFGQALQQQTIATNQSSQEDFRPEAFLAQLEPGPPFGPEPDQGAVAPPAAGPDEMIGPCVPPEVGDPGPTPGLLYLDAALEEFGDGYLLTGAARPRLASSNDGRAQEAPAPNVASVFMGSALLLSAGYRLSPRPGYRRTRPRLPGRTPQP
jgi:subtilase family serine protease